MLRKAVSSASDRTRWSQWRLAVPMPCSALMEPLSSATLRNTPSSTRLSSGAGPVMLTWMLPSLTWPNSQVRAVGSMLATRDGTCSTKSASAPAGNVTSSLWGGPRVLIASVWASRYRQSWARRDGSVATTASASRATEAVASARSAVGSRRSATSTSRTTGWRSVKGLGRPVTVPTSSRPASSISSQALRVGSARRRTTAAATASAAESKASRAVVRSGVGGTSRRRAAVTTAKVPSLPHSKPGRW